MLAISILVACLASQPQSSEAFDLGALEQRIAARDRALSAFAWDFEMHPVILRGDCFSRHFETGSVAQRIGRLVTDGVSRRVEMRNEHLGLETVAVWDGQAALKRTQGIAGVRRLMPLAPTYEEHGTLESVIAGYLPESFGIGYCGTALPQWFEHHDFTELGRETLGDRTCRKLLMRMSAPAPEVQGVQLDTVRALLWIDEPSLLVMRGWSLVRVEPTAPLHRARESFEFEGRHYAAQSTWEVIETTKVGDLELPVLGRYSRHPYTPGSAYEVDIRPQAAPPAGWPAGTFELPIAEGALVRDARTGDTRIHRASSSKASTRTVSTIRAPMRARCPGSDS